MPRTAEILSRYRLLALAVLVSAALHAALVAGIRGLAAEPDAGASAAYFASIDPQAAVATDAPNAAKAAPKPAVHRPRARRASPPPTPPAPAPEPEPPPAPVEPVAAAQPAPPAEPLAPAQPEPPPPDKVALAEPIAPLQDPPPPPEPQFPVEALPARLTINYDLKSALADARAVYRWRREGDNYRITGEGEAVGFFTLFLEGRIVQESTGTVTAAGLRPGRFTEKKPNTVDEGLEFDWPAHTVTFEYGTSRKTAPLSDNTVDWLSMIFQLAHVPPTAGAESLQLRVFTQRRLYNFDLKVLGEEEIDIPLGKVRALHLRHVDPESHQVVDVWLGMDQHYLPVKMRYPVARNRLMVEQTATRVSER